MARAKRTERAEARRRYRATLATDPLAEDADGADESSGSRLQPGRQARERRAEPASRDRAARPSGSASSTPSSCRSGPSTSARTSPRCRGSRSTRRRSGCRSCITIGAHDRDGRDRRERHGDRPAVHLLRRLPGDRRGLHRRLPRAAGQLARRRDRRPRVGRLLRRAWALRACCRRRSPSSSRSMRRGAVGLGVHLLADHRAPSSPPRRPGIAASSPCRARTANRRQSQAQKQRPGDGRTRSERQRHLAEGRAKRSHEVVAVARRRDRGRISRAGASRRGRAGGRRPADPARRPRRPPRGVAATDRAITLTTSPSRWSSPSTSSRACRRTTLRSRAQVSGQSVTLTIPVSSSRARKTVPLAVIGCWRVTTSPPIRTRPDRLSESAALVTAPSRSSAGRKSVTTCRRASSPITA